MDKVIIKEIFLFSIEICKAFLEILWKIVAGCFKLLWDRFFGASDISSQEKAEVKEWGVTGEDQWPASQKFIHVDTKEPSEQKQEPQNLFTARAGPEPPESYGENRIVLMIQNPDTLYCYWETKTEVFDTLLHELGTTRDQVKTLLRVYDVTDIIFDGHNAHTYFDIEIPREAKNWYIHVDNKKRAFCVDVGILTKKRVFRTLSRSNVVFTPPTGISDIIDEEWMDIRDLYAKIPVQMDRKFEKQRFSSITHKIHKVWQEIQEEEISSSRLSK